ncbi:F-box only protein 21-like [Ornithodoros turicata]|uniref:F-box only protein 21-like n=1 Tax=Ornithodoros turicata TaxID=34597 RepID=UPI0031386917
MAAQDESLFTLDVIPHEILEHILSFPEISIHDLCNASKVCAKFRDVVCSNELWRQKFVQRWPDLFRQHNAVGTRWREDCSERFTCGKKLRKCIASMSEKFYTQDELSEDAFTEILHLSKHPRAMLFYIDELYAILDDGMPDDNLTVKYYARRVQCFVCHEHLKSLWDNYLGFPDDVRKPPLLEDGALLLAEWCQPLERIDTEGVRQTLDLLAAKARTLLANRHPSHPILKAAFENGTSSDLTLESRSRWQPSECRAVLTCINHVLFQVYALMGEKHEFYTRENSFIDKVLQKKTGIPIALCVIYEAIARRLGVLCLPVSFPGHFLLKWLEHPELPEDQRYTYIDPFNGGRFLTQKECPQICPGIQIDNSSSYDAVPPIRVLVRMCWNLVEVGRQQEGTLGMQGLRQALELLELFERLGHNPCAGAIEHRLLLARVYLHLGINYAQVMSLLQDIEAAHPASSGIVAYMYRSAQSQMAAQQQRKEARNHRQVHKQRSTSKSQVAFTIGLIMKHKKYHYQCVIYGWDSTCAANRDWIYQMGVYNLSRKDRQPFYNVLVEDGSNRYAAQENLTISTDPSPISHPEVGKYFERFCGTHYTPNEQKEGEYPEDAEVRKDILQQSYGSTPTRRTDEG